MKVLVAIEDPIFGKIILDFICNHRWMPRTHFHLVHVLAGPRGLEPAVRHEKDAWDNAKQMLMTPVHRLQTSVPGCVVDYELCSGDAVTEILSVAKRWHPKLVVLGSHARSPIARTILGSVSQSLLNNLDCSALVVRVPNKPLEQLTSDILQKHKLTLVHTKVER